MQVGTAIQETSPGCRGHPGGRCRVPPPWPGEDLLSAVREMASLDCGAGRAPRQVFCCLLARRPQVWLPSRVRLHLSTPLGNSEHAVGAAPPINRGRIRPGRDGSWPYYRPIPDEHTPGDTYQPDGCRPKGPPTRKVAFNHKTCRFPTEAMSTLESTRHCAHYSTHRSRGSLKPFTSSGRAHSSQKSTLSQLTGCCQSTQTIGCCLASSGSAHIT